MQNFKLYNNNIPTPLIIIYDGLYYHGRLDQRWCVFLFPKAEWMSSRSRSGANGQTFWGLHRLHIGLHTDFKIFIFRRQIYIILIYLLQRPYFNIVVLK